MKNKIDRDRLTDFEFTVLKYIKQSVPFTYSKKNDVITFKKETVEFIFGIGDILDGSIKEIIWNEDNVKFFNKHRNSVIELLQDMQISDCKMNDHSAVSIISYYRWEEYDDINLDDIAKGLFDKSIKNPDIHSWEFQVQSTATIYVVKHVISKLQDILSADYYLKSELN